MSNIFQRADFSRDDSVKQSIYHQMKQTVHDSRITVLPDQLSDDDLEQVAAAGLPVKRDIPVQ